MALALASPSLLVLLVVVFFGADAWYGVAYIYFHDMTWPREKGQRKDDGMVWCGSIAVSSFIVIIIQPPFRMRTFVYRIILSVLGLGY